MNKIIFLILFFVFGYNSFSQLLVKDGAYIFNNDKLVYVKQNINLATITSNFYLRNKAQLIQGTTGVSSNSGLGKLSVFQEGTSNQYVYNYWCSPVGNPSDANNKFGITFLHRPTSLVNSLPITTTSYDGSTSASSLVIAKYWIWKYLNSNGYNLNLPNGWIHVEDASTLNPGEGFTMKGVSGTDATNVGESTPNNPGENQRYDFRGRPNDGTINVGVDANKYTLTGNPYPSAMNVSAFLLDAANSACTGIAYYWEQNKTDNSHVLVNYHGGYGTYAPVSAPYTGVYTPATYDTYNSDGSFNSNGSSSGLTIERKFAPIGQGFMVEGNTSGTITIKNEYRDYIKEDLGLSQFERNATSSQNNNTVTTGTQVPHLRFDISLNNQYTRQLALIVMPEATDNVDRGIDAKSPAEETLPNDVYFFIDNDQYVIQGVSFDIDKRIKVGVKSNPNTNFNFRISHIINFDTNQDVFLYDGLTQTYHDIKNSNFDITLPGGVINDRFEITFIASALNTVKNLEENFAIYQNNDSQTLSIENPNLIDVNLVMLFDISGKTIFAKNKLGIENVYKFPTNTLSEGIYIVKLVTNTNQSLSHKIIVKNTKK